MVSYTFQVKKYFQRKEAFKLWCLLQNILLSNWTEEPFESALGGETF